MALFTIPKKTAMGDDTKYSRAIRTPQYTPKCDSPNISELCDYEKYAKFIADINSSNVTEEEKKFLRLGASRHIAFNFSRIADYYATASPEMQELMEKQALVILDIDDAIKNGYVRLSERMEQLVEEAKARK